MIALLNIFEIVAPVFILTAIGYFWIKIGFEYPVEFVTQFSTILAVPCLVFTALMKTEIQSNDFINVLVAAIIGYIFLAIIAFAFVKIFNLGLRTYLMPLIVGNTGNLGFPLCLFAFGDPGFGYAIIVFALTSIALPIVLLLTLLIAMVFTACYGWTVEKLAYKPLRKSFRLGVLKQ